MADDATTNDDGDQFEEALPLPDELKIDHAHDLPSTFAKATADLQPERATAADLIRQRIDAAYDGSSPLPEPDFSDEALEVAEEKIIQPTEKLSKHQQFVYDLSASGRPLHDINAAWHEYYAGLSDEEKHQVWQEFNEAHLQASKLLKALPGEQLSAEQQPSLKTPKPRTRRQPSPVEKAVIKHSKRLAKQAVTRIPERHRQPLKSLVFGLTIGLIAIFIFLFTFFNERFIAPFIQPSRTVSSSQVITANGPISTKPEILIPKINVEIPVIYWVKSTNDQAVEDGLDNGVVHYADTAQPGQDGNVAIVGHSASNIFNKGRYKFAFSLLRRVNVGDTFYLQKDGVRYTYQVYKKRVVKPTDVSVLAPDPHQAAIATLITCDPPGTSSNRLIVVGKQISPSPAKNQRQTTDNRQAQTQTDILPGNAPTLWSRIVKWFTGN